MTPSEIIESIVQSIQSADVLPDHTNYIGYEPNIDTEPIKLPLVEVTPTTKARVSDHNTDEQGVIEDDNGNAVGRVFHALYQLTVQVNIWTAQGSRHDPNELGSNIHDVLYQYSSVGPGKELADDVWRVQLGDSSPDEDFTTSPTARLWTQEVDVWAYETFTTDESYIVGIVAPESGDFGNSSDVGSIDNG